MNALFLSDEQSFLRRAVYLLNAEAGRLFFRSIDDVIIHSWHDIPSCRNHEAARKLKAKNQFDSTNFGA
jgi:hypothetical protein